MVGLLVWFAGALVILAPWNAPGTGSIGGALACLGALGTGAAYVLNYQLITDEGPTATSTVTYLLPVVAVALGIVFLGEPAAAHLLIGTGIVLVGIALVQRRRPAPVESA